MGQEERRPDLPSLKSRSDLVAIALQQALCPEAVLAALDGHVTLPEGSSSEPGSATLEEQRVTRHGAAGVGASGSR